MKRESPQRQRQRLQQERRRQGTLRRHPQSSCCPCLSQGFCHGLTRDPSPPQRQQGGGGRGWLGLLADPGAQRQTRPPIRPSWRPPLKRVRPALRHPPCVQHLEPPAAQPLQPCGSAARGNAPGARAASRRSRRRRQRSRESLLARQGAAAREPQLSRRRLLGGTLRGSLALPPRPRSTPHGALLHEKVTQRQAWMPLFQAGAGSTGPWVGTPHQRRQVRQEREPP